MESKKTVRNSNFELLRILAIFMIIMAHIMIHSIYVELTDTANAFNEPLFFKRLMWLVAIRPFGSMNNAVFLLISGFFLGGANEKKINLAKTAKKLLTQTAFAAFILIVASTAVYRHTTGIYVNMMSANMFNRMSWYVGYYFMVILIAAVFLNKYLYAFDKKQYNTFLLVAFAIISFSWSGGLADSLASGLRTLFTGLFLFSLGGYLRRFDPLQRVRIWVFFAVIAFLYSIVFIESYNQVHNSIQDYWRNGGGDFIQNSLIPDLENYNIMIIGFAICLFELFRRIKMPKCKVINFVASATFMIYLLHDNEFFYSLWGTIDWMNLLHDHLAEYIETHILCSLATFGVGFAVYLAYIGIVALGKKCKWIAIRKMPEAL